MYILEVFLVMIKWLQRIVESLDSRVHYKNIALFKNEIELTCRTTVRFTTSCRSSGPGLNGVFTRPTTCVAPCVDIAERSLSACSGSWCREYCCICASSQLSIVHMSVHPVYTQGQCRGFPI